MEYSRRVERAGECGGNRISSRTRREDRRRKVVFSDFSENFEEKESSCRESSEENPFQEKRKGLRKMTPEQMNSVVQKLRAFGEDPRALLEIHTPSTFSGEEERSGHWVDSRG